MQIKQKKKNLEINYKLFFATPLCNFMYTLLLFPSMHTHTYTLCLCFIQVTHAQSISNSSLSSPSPLFSLF